MQILPNYDIDTLNLIIGFARSGKSTLALDIIRRFLFFRNMSKDLNVCLPQFAKIFRYNTAFDEDYDLQNNFKYIRAEPILIDEGYLVADRRFSMTDKQIRLTHTINTNARNNNSTFMLIQNSTDLDMRFIAKANTIFLITARNLAYVYVKSSKYPIVKEFSAFKKFLDAPDILDNETLANFELKRNTAFLTTTHWIDLGKSTHYSKIFDYYLNFKNNKLLRGKLG